MDPGKMVFEKRFELRGALADVKHPLGQEVLRGEKRRGKHHHQPADGQGFQATKPEGQRLKAEG